MSLRICSKDFNSLFTSSTRTPAPAAMRFFRLAPMISGFSRSLGVMDRMMASVWAMAFSSSFTPLRLAPPGIWARISSMEPMDFICTIWS